MVFQSGSIDRGNRLRTDQAARPCSPDHRGPDVPESPPASALARIRLEAWASVEQCGTFAKPRVRRSSDHSSISVTTPPIARPQELPHYQQDEGVWLRVVPPRVAATVFGQGCPLRRKRLPGNAHRRLRHAHHPPSPRHAPKNQPNPQKSRGFNRAVFGQIWPPKFTTAMV